MPCAILEKDGKIFAAQRSASMSLPFKWEFPGGKVDEGETEEEALEREIMEELSIEIEIGQRMTPVFKEDHHRIICLVPYLCQMVSGPIILMEHAQYKWVTLSEVSKLDWAEADKRVIANYLRETHQYHASSHSYKVNI